MLNEFDPCQDVGNELLCHTSMLLALCSCYLGVAVPNIGKTANLKIFDHVSRSRKFRNV